MKRGIAAWLAVASTAASSWADSRSMTLYADGARVEIEASATRGTIQVPLPTGLMENSLRIQPQEGVVIQRVVFLPTVARQDPKSAEALQEQKERLEDRLRALGTREEVFKAAAKSQSGKAPRKTKSNPDPMQSIRQGTEFAIAQLEAVYTARRKTEQELRRLTARIAAARRAAGQSEKTVRVTVSPARGRVRLSYLLASPGWTASYDLRLASDGRGRATLFGEVPEAPAGYQLQAVPAGLAASSTPAVAVIPGAPVRLAEYDLTVSDMVLGPGLPQTFSALLTNRNAVHLPPGPAVLYRNGEYWGQLRFEGISSGRSRRISLGE